MIIKELNREEICKEFIHDLIIKIEGFAQEESGDFNKDIHHSCIGDLNQALKVIELYTEQIQQEMKYYE